jgi:hypothetical protein
VPSLIEAQRYFGIPCIQRGGTRSIPPLLSDSFILAIVGIAIAHVEIRFGWFDMVCKSLVELN